MKYAPLLLLLMSVAGTAGCGKKEDKSPLAGTAVVPKEAEHGAVEKKGAEGKEAELPRKIQYTAEIRLIVTDLGEAASQLRRVVKEHKGFVAKSEENTSPGTIRHGTWRIRVPVEQFEPLRDAVREIGEIEKNSIDSVDVTEEYYDLQQHIKNKLAEEEGLRELLKKMTEKTDKIEAFLQVRDKLEDVRDYINRQEGRLRMLENLTNLATLNVHLREKQRFDPDMPPKAVEEATFGQRAGRIFTDSLDALRSFFQALLLVVIAVSPWLIPLAVVGLPAWFLLRWRRPRKVVPSLDIVEPAPAGTDEENRPSAG